MLWVLGKAQKIKTEHLLFRRTRWTLIRLATRGSRPSAECSSGRGAGEFRGHFMGRFTAENSHVKDVSTLFEVLSVVARFLESMVGSQDACSEWPSVQEVCMFK